MPSNKQSTGCRSKPLPRLAKHRLCLA